MSSLYLKANNFLNNGKNFYKIFFFLVVFLCIVKLPSLITSDIQPWDEGMYAVRVLSIHVNGDFIDQSTHSAGKFYSASHPPLLIWIGYFVTLVFGVNSIALKLIIFILSLLCVLLILLIGRNLFDTAAGFYAALIFCSNIIFTVFSQRFQFDIPYTFFILLSFYFFFLYNDSLKIKYLLLSGFSLGCCLMTKILVGFYIPVILFISYFFIKDKINFRLKDIFLLTLTGILTALPWHLYMLSQFGSEFTDYFFKFHIYDRALHGVEMNEKNSGMFYHLNYLLSIIPYSILVFIGLFTDLKNFKTQSWKKIFMYVWFITGLIILTLFKTKLEVYVLMILVPASFLIPLFINEIKPEKRLLNAIILFLTLLNVIWFATESLRPELKMLLAQNNKIIILFSFAMLILILYFIVRFLANKIELKNTLYIFILIFFFGINIYYLFFTPKWVNNFKLSGMKEYVDKSGKEKIIYIGSDYRLNPQFSYYFKGLNLNWENPDYEFRQIDTKDKDIDIRKYLSRLDENSYCIIVEKDYINRAQYPASETFIPPGIKLILKDTGYELYEN